MSKKITLTELRAYIKKEAYKILKELETGTYASLMDKTSDYPWTKFLSPDSKDKYTNPRHKGAKEERINTKSRARFIEEFYKEFPINSSSTEIITNKGKYDFKAIKFNTNYTSYDLIFSRKENDGWETNLWIKPERSGYYITDDSIKIEDVDSNALLNRMLKYNLVKK